MSHSTGHILEISWSFANESIRAVKMFEYRLLHELEEDNFFAHKTFRDNVDFHCYLIFLLRLKKAIKLGFKFFETNGNSDELSIALKEFEANTSFLNNLRNVGEHFDDYSQSLGANKSINTGLLRVYQSGSQNGDSYVMNWMGYKINTKEITQAASKLYRAFTKKYKEAVSLSD